MHIVPYICVAYLVVINTASNEIRQLKQVDIF